MKVGFDVSQTGSSKAGCGYFAESLIRHLAAIDLENEYILYPAVGDVFWDPECGRETFSCNQKNFRRLAAPKSFEASQTFWRDSRSDLEARLGDPDIVHINNFYCPRGLRKAHLVYTLHDLSFIAHPEWTTEANRIGCAQNVFQASLQADLIVAVSEYTRRHFLETFPHYPAERIVVVHEGSRFTGCSPAPAPAQFDRIEPARFWLSVGTIEPRKNYARILEAYAAVYSNRPNLFPLVIAGGKGWLMEEFERSLESAGLRGRVILTGYVSDRELQWLYENCFAFLYPSLFEGFGLPVLEAMSLGAPAISSNTTSIPEVVGDAGILVNPECSEEIAEAMLRLFDGLVDRNALAESSRARAAQFSWDSSARAMLDVYRQVAESRSNSTAALAAGA